MNTQQIEDLLKRYYPKGIKKKDPRYWSSGECKNFENLVVNTVHKPSTLYKEWQEFLHVLSNDLNVPVSDFTDGQIPSFFACITKSPSKKPLSLPGLNEEICIYKSFLGNYFSVIGSRRIHWTSSTGFPVITPLEAFISPSKYTSDLFNTVFESVNTFSEIFQFMSYKRGQTILEDFDLPFSDKNPSILFDAIFAPFDFSGYKLIGDIEYDL